MESEMLPICQVFRTVQFQSERGETVHINPDLVRAVWERAADKFALVFGDDRLVASQPFTAP
jgi:hypothetical protein